LHGGKLEEISPAAAKNVVPAMLIAIDHYRDNQHPHRKENEKQQHAIPWSPA
jgi:hypothetical protein